jgi:hypothetical protein
MNVRRTVAEAAAWRLIAELFRRHASRYDLRVAETHPGDIYDCRSVFAGPGWKHVLDINLVGRVHVVGTLEQTDAAARMRPFDVAEQFLCAEDTKGIVDEVESAIGLPTVAGGLPRDSAPVAMVRLIAAVLARAVFDRVPVRSDSACLANPWRERIGLPRLESDEAGWRRSSRYWRLSGANDGVVFDLADGEMTDLMSGTRQRIDVAKFGRHEPGDLIDWIYVRVV